MLSNKEMPQATALSTAVETTLVIIKPEEIESRRAPAIFSVVERICRDNGLELEARSITLDKNVLEAHYFGKGQKQMEAVGKKVAKSLTEAGFVPDADDITLAERALRNHVNAYTGKTAVVIKVTGPDAIAKMNSVKGSTDPSKVDPATIRGQFSTGTKMVDFLRQDLPVRNIVHIPETKEEATFDIENFWHNASRLVDFERIR
jgi:nucleoside diphosphate kinase